MLNQTHSTSPSPSERAGERLLASDVPHFLKVWDICYKEENIIFTPMAHFPVTSSILSAEQLAHFLQQHYALDGSVSCRILKSGINDTYLVSTAAAKFVFRVYSFNWRTQDEILEELRLIGMLREHNIAVSYPLAAANGSYILLLHAPEGDRYGVLFSYAEGEKMHNYDEDTHFNVGVLMAQVHKATHNTALSRVTYGSDNMLTEPYEELRKFLPDDCEEMQFMQSALQYLQSAFSNINTDKVRHGVVHMDIWFDNMNISKDKQITLFDFDFCGNGWLCLDIAYYILQVNSVERDETICRQKVNSFIKGYESITAITEEERRIIPMLGVSIYFFYLGIQCRRYDNWSNSFLNTTYLKRFITALVKRYFDMVLAGKVLQ